MKYFGMQTRNMKQIEVNKYRQYFLEILLASLFFIPHSASQAEGRIPGLLHINHFSHCPQDASGRGRAPPFHEDERHWQCLDAGKMEYHSYQHHTPNFWQIAITVMAVLAEFKEGGQRRVAQKVLFARIMEVRSNQIGVPPNKAYDDEYLFMVGRQG